MNSACLQFSPLYFHFMALLYSLLLISIAAFVSLFKLLIMCLSCMSLSLMLSFSS